MELRRGERRRRTRPGTSTSSEVGEHHRLRRKDAEHGSAVARGRAHRQCLSSSSTRRQPPLSEAFGDSSTAPTAPPRWTRRGRHRGILRRQRSTGAAGRFTSRGIFEPQRMLSGDAFLAQLTCRWLPLWSRSLGATGSSQLPTSLVTARRETSFMAGGFRGVSRIDAGCAVRPTAPRRAARVIFTARRLPREVRQER